MKWFLAVIVFTVAGTGEAMAASNEFRPSFSPDGRFLVFFSDRDGDNEIYLMELGTGAIRQLTDNNVSDAQPVFSPDGRQIAWNSGDASVSAIFVMNLDGGDKRQVSPTDGVHIRPAWWPDGDRLFYHSKENGSWRLRSVAVDGSDVRQHGDKPGDYLTAAFRPDGHSIIYVYANPGDAHDQPIECHILNLVDGRSERFLPDEKGNSNFAFSPDNKRIVFNSIRDLNWEVYMMDADGGNQRRLTADETPELTFDAETIDGQPTWSPDGSMIAFISGRKGDFDIYLMNPDSGWLVNLTGAWQ